MAGSEEIDRVVWTDADFEAMNWHDATVHAIALQTADVAAGEVAVLELLLDIDYIISWITPRSPLFGVAPSTLVFEDVWEVKGNIDVALDQLEIADIERGEVEDAVKDAKVTTPRLRRWMIHGHNFELSFLASGYRQHIRRLPIEVFNRQSLDGQERGGFSFDQPTETPVR